MSENTSSILCGNKVEMKQAKGLIIEGVAGSGKTTVLKKIVAFLPRSVNASIFYEEETFGDFMEELSDKVPAKAACHRLDQAIDKISILKRNKFPILERFHYSYFALIPDWDLYASMDLLLAEKGFRSAVLFVPENQIQKRSLYRKEKTDEWSKGMIDYFGSASEALQALKTSQWRRKDVLRLSKIPSIQINTQLMDWDVIATKIVKFLFRANPGE